MGLNVAKTLVGIGTGHRGTRAYRIQVVEGATQAEVERLIALALAAEKKLAKSG